MTDRPSAHPGALGALHPQLRDLGAACLEQLAARLEPRTYRAGQAVFGRGEPVDAVFVVLEGEAAAFARREDGAEVTLGRVKPGEFVGEFSILSGGTRSADVRVTVDTRVGRCPRLVFLDLCDTFPQLRTLILRVVRERLDRNRLATAMSALLGTADAATMDYVDRHGHRVHLRRGTTFFKQGEPADTVGVVLNGRLRLERSVDGDRRVDGEVVRGGLVGEAGWIAGDRHRASSAYALRDSDVLSIAHADFERLVSQHPAILRSLLRAQSERRQEGPVRIGAQAAVTNIAVVALDGSVDGWGFTQRLQRSLNRLGSAAVLRSDAIDAELTTAAASNVTFGHEEYARLVWRIEEQEASHDYVVYHADDWVSLWTHRCVRQADLILLLASADAEPSPRDVEHAIAEGDREATRTVLVLIHSSDTVLPRGTDAWLTPRAVHRHHHIRHGSDADIGRLARIETGHGIGVVLSGGGARCAAHVGVLRALESAGIPIDMIGGTSGGGGVALQYAMGASPDEILERGRLFTTLGVMRAFTAPMISVLSPKKPERIAAVCGGDARIEDTWLPGFCVSYDMSTGEKVIHTRGRAAKAMLATGAIPGIFPPVVEGTHLLVDGGVVDNLPAEVMRQQGAGRIIASNVSAGMSLTVSPPDHPLPSGWRYLRSTLNPFAKPLGVPNLIELVTRLVVINDRATIERAQRETDLMLRPPVQNYPIMQFDAIEAMSDAAYDYTIERFRSGRPDTLPFSALRDAFQTLTT